MLEHFHIATLSKQVMFRERMSVLMQSLHADNNEEEGELQFEERE